MPKLLFFGDIFGRPGRTAIAQVLPMLKESYSPDVVIGNVENLAHGKGVTPATIAELDKAGFDAYTSGNHILSKFDTGKDVLLQHGRIVRPANYAPEFPGVGFLRIEKKGQQYLIINLNGLVFFDPKLGGGMSSPFSKVDEILKDQAREGDIILVDFHADATSEKRAMGFHLDGRVGAVLGTHSHVPTQDFQVLSKGTAYVTDVGMNGVKQSILGSTIESSMNLFTGDGRFKGEPAEGNPIMINAVLVDASPGKPAIITKIFEEINI